MNYTAEYQPIEYRVFWHDDDGRFVGCEDFYTEKAAIEFMLEREEIFPDYTFRALKTERIIVKDVRDSDEKKTCFFCKNMFFRGIEWGCKLKHKTGMACSEYDEDIERKDSYEFCMNTFEKIGEGC